MVKSGAPEPAAGVSAAERLAQSLRQEGESLLQTRRLVQKNPVTPLQLHDIRRIIDPVLLSPGSSVSVLTDRHGQAALAVARARPHWQVTGLVSDTRTLLNMQNLNTPANLFFDKYSATPQKKPHAILAVGWAHQILSQNHFHVSALLKALRELLAQLPENGQLLIQDFATPEQNDRFVVIDLEQEEAARALVEFSVHARPEAPEQLRGFFIETLVALRPGVQRFRLPYKWAVEFYHRWRLGIAVEAPYELTTLSLDQWAALLEQCEARVTYRAPHSLSRTEKNELSRFIHFYDEDERPLGLPTTSFTLLVEKIGADKGVNFYERRLSSDPARNLVLTGARNATTNEKTDIVEVQASEDDVLPWYMDEDHQLRVLIRTQVPRPIINMVARGTPNIDGRQWAGYLVEPLTMPHRAGEPDPDEVRAMVAENTHMPVTSFGNVEAGIDYYPAPEYLMQRVRGIFVATKNGLALDGVAQKSYRVVDVLADDVLGAIACGFIPDGKLEILISKLMIDLGVTPRDMGDATRNPDMVSLQKKTINIRDLMAKTIKSGVKLEKYLNDTPAGKRRAVRSVFVEDSVHEHGREIGHFKEFDFIVPTQLTSNTVVCIPVARDPMGRFLLAGEPKQLPIPQRMGTEEPLMLRPSFALPDSVKTLDQIRFFLAKQMEADPDDFYPLGPSFFVQPKISAERVYPFLYQAKYSGGAWLRWYRPRSRLIDLLKSPVEKSSAYVEFKALRELGEWYKGFTPELAQEVTQKIITAPKPSSDMQPKSSGFAANLNDNMRPKIT